MDSGPRSDYNNINEIEDLRVERVSDKHVLDSKTPPSVFKILLLGDAGKSLITLTTSVVLSQPHQNPNPSD